jgi:hypothetical protein
LSFSATERFTEREGRLIDIEEDAPNDMASVPILQSFTRGSELGREEGVLAISVCFSDRWRAMVAGIDLDQM